MKHNDEIDIYVDEITNQPPETLYDRIKKLCDEHNMSVSALERALGFSRAYLIKWKTTSPSADKLQRVADFFGVSLDYLVSGVETEKLDDDIISIQRARRKMPEKDQKRMMEMLHIAFEEAFRNGDEKPEE